MSDPSVFINEMMRYPDNRQFAKAVARYLTGGDKQLGGVALQPAIRSAPGFAPSTTLSSPCRVFRAVPGVA